MTIKELKEYSKKLLFSVDYDKIQKLTKKNDIIDNIVLKMFRIRYNIPLRLKHNYITNKVIEDTESLKYITDVRILDNTRLVKILDAKPYFYLGSVKYETGKELSKNIKKDNDILSRVFYRYLIGGYDIYVSRKDQYVPFK